MPHRECSQVWPTKISKYRGPAKRQCSVHSACVRCAQCACSQCVCEVCGMRACAQCKCTQCVRAVCTMRATMSAYSVYNACVQRAQCVRAACTVHACSLHNACVQFAQCVRAACTVRACSLHNAGVQRAQCVCAHYKHFHQAPIPHLVALTPPCNERCRNHLPKYQKSCHNGCHDSNHCRHRFS